MSNTTISSSTAIHNPFELITSPSSHGDGVGAGVGGAKLFVSGIPRNMLEADVKTALKTLFPASEASVVLMVSKTVNKGCAFVHFTSPAEAAASVLASLQAPLEINGAALTLKQTAKLQPPLPPPPTPSSSTTTTRGPAGRRGATANPSPASDVAQPPTPTNSALLPPQDDQDVGRVPPDTTTRVVAADAAMMNTTPSHITQPLPLPQHDVNRSSPTLCTSIATPAPPKLTSSNELSETTPPSPAAPVAKIAADVSHQLPQCLAAARYPARLTIWIHSRHPILSGITDVTATTAKQILISRLRTHRILLCSPLHEQQRVVDMVEEDGVWFLVLDEEVDAADMDAVDQHQEPPTSDSQQAMTPLDSSTSTDWASMEDRLVSHVLSRLEQYRTQRSHNDTKAEAAAAALCGRCRSSPPVHRVVAGASQVGEAGRLSVPKMLGILRQCCAGRCQRQSTRPTDVLGMKRPRQE